MNTKTRPVYIIERDIRETMDKAAKAVRQGRYMDAAMLAKEADGLKEELSHAMELVKFDEDNRNMDKSLRSWFGKILSLSLNEADMALYHIDMFFCLHAGQRICPRTGMGAEKARIKGSRYRLPEFRKALFQGRQQSRQQ